MQTGSPVSKTRALILSLFFLSGACTLIYEVVWARMLVLVFGLSVFAISTVLSAFMAGLALGSVYFGRVADKRVNVLRVYAYLELGIGAFALVFPFVISGLDDLYTVFYRSLYGGAYAFSLVRFLVSFAVLLVPTTLMGATLPVLSKFAVDRISKVGWNVGVLYAVNTLGAAAGCFLAVFVLLEQLGVRGTTFIAAGTNLLIAAVAFLMSFGSRPPAPDAGEHAAMKGIPDAARQQVPRYVASLVLWGFALSGFTALGYEVVWSRLFSTLLRLTTTQSLSTLLVAFLFGLAVGGWAGARLADRLRDPASAFGVVQLSLGLFGLGSIAVLGVAPSVLAGLGPSAFWLTHVLRLFAVAFAVMLIPTCLMGASFPLVGRLYALGLGSLGRRIGVVYAANTAGAILGAFAAGFVLIPAFGTQKSIELLAWLNIGVGATVVLVGPAMRRTKFGMLSGMLTPILVLVLLLPSDALVDLSRRSRPRTTLLYQRETIGGTVTVHEFENGDRMLRVNGAGEVPTGFPSIQTFRLLGNLPLIVHPSPDEVLVIAFGGGITLAAVEQHRPRRLDCVEVVEGVLSAAPLFARYNSNVAERLDTDAFNVIVDDGRNHVLRTEQLYDVIIGDATHPATADSWVLYTEEFYQLCRRRLKEGGVFAQWLPLHGLAVEDYKMVLRTFQSVFPHTSLWMTEGYTVLLGTPGPLEVDLDRLEKRLGEPGVRENLAEVDMEDSLGFLAAFALDERAVAAYVGSGPKNTDDRPHVSFADRMRGGTRTGLSVMISLVPYLSERLRVATGSGSEAEVVNKLQLRLAARRHTILGQIALRRGDRDTAIREFRLARELDPGEKGAKRSLWELEGNLSP